MGAEPQGSTGRRSTGHGRELALLVIAAFLVRYSLFAFRGDYLDWDETLYLLMARNLLAGEGLSVNGLPHLSLGPLVPVLTAVASRVSGISPLTIHRLLAALAGALLVLPVWYLVRLVTEGRIARIAAALVVGWTVLIDVAPRFGPMWDHFYAGSEPFYLAALFGAFALGELGLRRGGTARLASLAGAGVLLALAYLARSEAVVIGGLYAVLRGVELLRDGRAREVAAGLGFALAAFLVVAAPHLVRLRQLTGSWTPSGHLGPTASTADLYQEVVRDDRKIGPYLQVWWALDSDHERMLNPYWGIERPGLWSQRLAEYRAVLAETWTPVTGGQRLADRAVGYLLALWTLCLPLFLPLALVGLWSGGAQARRFPPFVLATLVGSLLIAWKVYALPRFFLMLVPAFALWAALGVVRVAGWRGVQRLPSSERVVAFALLATGLGWAALRAIGDDAAMARERGRADRQAGERLGAAISTDQALISWHPRLAYWGGWDWRALPVESLDAVVHYAAHREVDGVFLARGSYSPLTLEAAYVVILLGPGVVDAYRELGADGSDPHGHPPATLVPVDAVAGFPTGLIRLGAPGSRGEE